MPELPDIEAYIEALRTRVPGQELQELRLAHPFLPRTVDPPLSAADGRRVAGIERLGNAHSDEILHRAELSPLKLTQDLTQEEMARLHEATLGVLSE